LAPNSAAVLLRYVDEVWNKGNLAAADAVVAPGYRHHDPAFAEQPGGLDGLKRLVARSHDTFPDIEITIEDLIAEGDRAVVRWTARGTHRGALLGIAATGRVVRMAGITVVRLSDGRVGESWTHWNSLDLLRQLGAVRLPPRAQASPRGGARRR